MSEIKICFLYTETNGLHKTYKPVSKKDMFSFARMMSLNYIIGYRKENGKFKTLINKRNILYPKHLIIPKQVIDIHGITREIAEEEGEDNIKIMTEFKKDLKDVKVIVSHSLDFHIKTVQTECFRTCTNIDFSKYLLIDTMSFYHNIKNPKLRDLAQQLLNKDYSKKEAIYNLILIKKCFMKLYNDYDEEHFSELN